MLLLQAVQTFRADATYQAEAGRAADRKASDLSIVEPPPRLGNYAMAMINRGYKDYNDGD